MRVLTVVFLTAVAVVSGLVAYDWRARPKTTVPPITLRADVDDAPATPAPVPPPPPPARSPDGGAAPVPSPPTPGVRDDERDDADEGSDDANGD